MKGLVMARMVLMNQDGCTIINDFRFFLSLQEIPHVHSVFALFFFPHFLSEFERNVLGLAVISAGMMDTPSVNHLVAFL